MRKCHAHPARLFLPVFENAVRELKAAGLTVIVHVILGLPDETKAQMLDTVRYLTDFQPAIDYQTSASPHFTRHEGQSLRTGTFSGLSMDEHIELLIECIRLLPPDMTPPISGDGPKLLVAPNGVEISGRF